MTLPRTTVSRRIFAIAILLIAGSLAFGLMVLRRPNDHGRTLEIELATSDGTLAQVFWDDGEGFNEQRSARARLEHTPGAFQVLRFPLPDSRIGRLRFDPIDGAGSVVVRRMRVLTSSGAVLAEPHSVSLVPLYQIEAIVRDGSLTRIATDPGATDPQLLLSADSLDATAAWYELSSVTPLSVMLACLTTLLLIVAGAWTVVREVLRNDPASRDRGVPRAPEVAWWLIALFGLTLATKLYTIHELPAPVPGVDQWLAEAGGLYIPFSEGHLTWRAMLALHNEHRIFFTRLADLFILMANGQWDPLVQELVNAVLHSVTGVLLAATLWLAGRRRRLDVVVLGCGLVFFPPFAWQNTISGVQSAFYFLLLFSILALWLVWRSPARSRSWAIGWTCALWSLFTSAGGLVTVGVATAFEIWRSWQDRERWKLALINMSVPAVVLTIGIATISPPLAHHAQLRPETFEDFAAALSRNLAWPWIESPFLMPILWLPLTIAFVRYLRRRDDHCKGNEWLFGLALWVVMQAVGLAYARGGRGQPLASRYMDFLSLGLVVNVVALVPLRDLAVGSRVIKRVGVMAIAIWLAFCVEGVDRVTRVELANGVGYRGWESNWVANVRRFVVTDDLAALATKQFPQDVPYFDPRALAAWLRHPYIRSILPPALHEPMRLDRALVTNEAFVLNGAYQTTPVDPVRPAWGSYTSQLNPAQGRFESSPVPQCSGLVYLEVAGYLGERGLSLALESLKSGKQTALETPVLAREQWAPTLAHCPDGPFKIVAIDANTDYWFAFRSPQAIAIGSGLAMELVARARHILFIAIALSLVGLRLSRTE